MKKSVNYHQPRLRQPGFTLLELLITTVLSAMLLLGTSSLFMTFMLGSARTNIQRQISAEGQQIIGTLEFQIRNAKSVDTCTNTKLEMTRLDNSKFSVCIDTTNHRIYYDPVSTMCDMTDTNLLNSTFVLSNDVSSNNISCPLPVNGKHIVNLWFSLSPKVDPSSLTTDFKAAILLRNS